MLSLSSSVSQPVVQQADASARSKQLQAQLTSGSTTLSGKPQDAKGAAAELGSLFILQMLQAMRRTIPKGSLLERGFAHETYVSMFDQEIARHMARREDLGLQSLLQRQLKDPGTNTKQAGPPSPDLLQPLSNGQKPTGLRPGVARDTALQAYRQPPGTATDSPFSLPLAGQQTSGFGWRTHPIHEDERFHAGVDIAAAPGSPIRAAAAGQVTFSGTQAGYGKVVILQHANGYSTLYAHNTENLVPVGATVRQGEPIATVGRTGDATGPHLHFEIQRDGQRLDPRRFLSQDPQPKKPVKFLMASADTEAIQ